MKAEPELEKVYPEIVRVFQGEVKEGEEGAQSLGALSAELQDKRKALEALMATPLTGPRHFHPCSFPP